MVPAGERAFEVVEAEFGLQLLVLLLDRPPVMGDAHDHLERGGHRQVHQVVLGARRGPEVALAEQPDLGGQPALPPVVGGGDPQRQTTVHRRPSLPLRQLTRCQVVCSAARVATLHGWMPGGRRGRPGTSSRWTRGGAGAACRGRPSTATKSPRHTAAATDARSPERRCCRRTRHRPAPRGAAAGAHLAERASTLAATSPETPRPPARGPAAAPPVSTTPSASRGPRRADTRALRSKGPPSRRPDSWRPCPACRTGARPRPNARRSATPRSGITARSRRQTHAASHGESVMKCWNPPDPSRARASPPSTSARCR